MELDGMDEKIPKLLEHGAVLDGPVKHLIYGKVAAVRCPDGHMLGLFEKPADMSDDQVDSLAAREAAREALGW